MTALKFTGGKISIFRVNCRIQYEFWESKIQLQNYIRSQWESFHLKFYNSEYAVCVQLLWENKTLREVHTAWTIYFCVIVSVCYLSIFNLFFTYMGVLPACICVHHMNAWCPLRVEVGVGSLELRRVVSCPVSARNWNKGFAEASGALNCWASSSAPSISFLAASAYKF